MTEPSASGRPALPEGVALLAARTYLAADLMSAAEVTADQLDLWQRKAGLLLCSEPLGRGRPRQFPLIDVYVFAVMARLTRLTGSPVWSAGSIGHVVYPPFPAMMQSDPVERSPAVDERRVALAADITAAHEALWTRSWHSQPWVLFAEDGHVRDGILGLEVANAADLDALVHRREGYFINLTRLLDGVDKRLVSIVGAA